MTRIKHCYPINHRPANLRERKEYYSGLDIGPMMQWFYNRPEGLRLPILHLDPGNETGYIRSKYKDEAGKLLFFRISKFEELKEWLIDFLPEDLYYDRNLYKDPEKCMGCSKRGKDCIGCSGLIGQELMFDIDPENIDCPNCGTLEDRVKGASMFKFCYICFNKAIEHTINLYDYLYNEEYERISVVYSGRGFHIYIEDDDSLYMNFVERKNFVKTIKEKGFGIDPWVTEGEARLARVPFSLNGMVSKICRPIEIREIKNLDFWRSRLFVPSFI
uniref:DNA primase n=1 Tax=Candidatus Methanomethylicus mesodigestus TaxID=1867258 RepID=A0A7C3EXN8_9CREN